VKEIGPLEVNTLIPNYPFEIHALTNYGIFIFTFTKNMTDNDYNFKNYTTRIIRLHSLAEAKVKYSWNFAANSWGYAFLVMLYNTHTTYNLYLGFMSFYAL
jgi:hypothetical protein